MLCSISPHRCSMKQYLQTVCPPYVIVGRRSVPQTSHWHTIRHASQETYAFRLKNEKMYARNSATSNTIILA